MSAKSNKIKLCKELMVMWKEEQPPEVFSCEFHKILRKTPMPESLF